MANEKDLNCFVVRDLLPNYIEGLTSQETNEQIEAHLTQCPPCNGSYNYMKARMELGESVTGRKDERGKKFFKKVRVKRMLVWFLAILMSAALFVIGLGRFNANRVVPAEQVHLENIYELADGRIVCAFRADDLLPGHGWINTSYRIPLHEEGKVNYYISIDFAYTLRSKLFETGQHHPFYYILDTEELASDVQRSLPMYDAVDEVRIKLELADNRLIWWEGREDVTVLNELDSKRLLDEISSIGYGGERIMTIEKAEATEIPLATSTPAPLRTLEPREYSLSSTPAPRVAN